MGHLAGSWRCCYGFIFPGAFSSSVPASAPARPKRSDNRQLDKLIAPLAPGAIRLQASGWRTGIKIATPITCRLPDPEKVSPALETYNSFTINALGQLGSNGTLLATEKALHLTRSPRRKSQNKRIHEVHPSANKRCHLAHDCRLHFPGPSRRQGRSRSWGISRALRTSRPPCIWSGRPYSCGLAP